MNEPETAELVEQIAETLRDHFVAPGLSDTASSVGSLHVN